MDPSTVYRTVKLLDETETVCSIQGFHVNTAKKLSIHDELAIIEMVLDDPSVCLHELHRSLIWLYNCTHLHGRHWFVL